MLKQQKFLFAHFTHFFISLFELEQTIKKINSMIAIDLFGSSSTHLRVDVDDDDDDAAAQIYFNCENFSTLKIDKLVQKK